MYTKRGSRRLVICLPSWGVVIKLPLIQPLVFLRCLRDAIQLAVKTGDAKRWFGWALWLDEENDTMGNIRYTLLNGVYQNWQEFQLWRKTRSPFLEQTIFSLFGLLNIQRYGTPLEVPHDWLWSQLLDLTEKSVWSNGHHFSNPDNFSFRDNHIRMIDYGGGGIANVVEKYGAQIVARYDPNKKPSWAK